MASEFEKQFPKPDAAENSRAMHRWLSKRIGYLAALETMHAKISQVVSLDSVALHIIEQEIEAVEKENK